MQRPNASAARAFARLRHDGAEEFDSLGRLAGRLGEKKEVQEDLQGTIGGFGVDVVPSEDGGWSLEASLPGRRLPFREHAFTQFCGRIGFPPSVLERCPLPLAKENVSYFSFLSREEPALVRTEEGEVRAFLSGDNRKVDHLEVVHKLLEANLPWEVNYAGLSPKRMFVLATEPESKWPGPDGSELSHCTLVGNSETGEGSFFAQDLWYDTI